MNSNGKAIAGIGFLDLLAVAFIVLKLCGVISWPWVAVLSPVWVPLVVVLIAVVVAVAVALAKD